LAADAELPRDVRQLTPAANQLNVMPQAWHAMPSQF
jgi:hypothetical protein